MGKIYIGNYSQEVFQIYLIERMMAFFKAIVEEVVFFLKIISSEIHTNITI